MSEKIRISTVDSPATSDRVSFVVPHCTGTVYSVADAFGGVNSIVQSMVDGDGDDPHPVTFVGFLAPEVHVGLGFGHGTPFLRQQS